MSSLTSDPAAAGSLPCGGAVIYEVSLDLPRRAARRLDVWLEQHMREMLALPGFVDARLLPADETPPGAAPDNVRRVVRYRLSGRAALDAYLDRHAARMHADGLRQFGGKLTTSRRLLDAQERELLSGAALPQATLRCLNCGAVLSGEFCAACGQRHHSYSAPLREVLEEFFGEHFGLDAKLLRSLAPLWFRPGFLSREYSAGRRARYISPLRLIVFSSLLFFLVAWGSAPAQFFHFSGSAGPAVGGKSAKSLTSEEQQEIRDIPYLSARQKQAILDSASVPGSGQPNARPAPASDADEVHGTVFGHEIKMSRAELQFRVQHAMESDLPKLVFVFLPLVALLLKLFYLRSRRYYTEHLVFALHNHAFVFEVMLVMLLIHLLGKRFAWVATPGHYVNLLIGWYMAVYVFLAMWSYYRQSFGKTLSKYILIGGIYWIVLFSIMITGTVLAFTFAVSA